MSVSVNHVCLAGNLTRDPEVKAISGDKMVAKITLAINHRYKSSSGEQKEETTFVDVEAWGRTAELVGQYLAKGRACLVMGRLKLDAWEKDGQKQSKLKVVADSVQFLDKGDAKATADKPAASVATRPSSAADKEEAPF